MNVFMILLVIFGVLVSTTNSQSKTPECSREFAETFPNHVTSSGTTLYVVDADHRLEPVFDEKCRLIQLTVAGNSRWNGGEDIGRGLAKAEYKQLFDRVTRAYPVGNAIESDTFGTSSPRGTTTWTRFQNALVQTTSYTEDRNGTQQGNIVSFTIFFVHEVEGKVTKRVLFDRSGFIKRSKISIDGVAFWSDEATFSATTLNRAARCKVFGMPVS